MIHSKLTVLIRRFSQQSVNFSGGSTWKLILVFVLAAGSIDILYTQATGSLFPAHPTFLAVVTVVGCLWVLARRGSHVAFELVLVVVIPTFYTTYTLLFPASLVGTDPPSYARHVEMMLSSGTVDAIRSAFYSKAPMYHLFVGFFSLVSGFSAVKSLFIVTVSGITIPLNIYLLTRLVADQHSHTVGLLSALIAATGSMVLALSFVPIAQTIATVIWVVSFLGFVYYWRTGDRRFVALATLLMFSQVYVHKLFPLIYAMILPTILVAVWFLDALDIRSHKFSPFDMHYLMWISAIFLVLQLAFTTEFIQSVIIKTIDEIATLGTNDPVGRQMLPDGLQAVNATDGLQLYYRLYLVVPVIVSGAFAAFTGLKYLFGGRYNDEIALTYVSLAILYILVVIAILSEGLNSLRILLVAYPLFGVVIALGLLEIWDADRLGVSTLLTAAIVVVLVSSQVYSPTSTLDFPNVSRNYATQAEIEGLAFSSEYTRGAVHTDAQYEAFEPGKYNRYRPITKGFLFGNLTEQDHRYVLFRDLNVYLTPDSYFRNARLRWNPGEQLEAEYQNVYANGQTDLYVNRSG